MKATPMAHPAVVTRVLEGDGRASHLQRRAAFDNAVLAEPLNGLISKIAKQPTHITDDDFTAVKASGLSENQIFELVVCAAVGQASRQYQSGRAALAVAMTEEGPEYASKNP